MDYAFTWDPQKAASNLLKHKISFDTAIQVFDDPHAVFLQDRIEDGEPRWQVIGSVKGIEMLLVAYASKGFDDNMEYIRIISARRADKHERQIYERQDG
jgi:uncharacterized protein